MVNCAVGLQVVGYFQCHYRYFGSAEGSRFVEEYSVDNVKRTWVNYGEKRDWMDPQQGQVNLWLHYTGHS